MRLLLGLDIGTTAMKTALYDEKGNLLALSTQEYTLITPEINVVEEKEEVYWEAFCSGLSELKQQVTMSRDDEIAMGISAQGETLFFLDENGKSLRNAIVWLDNRAEEEAESLRRRFGNEQCYQVTGQVSFEPCWPAAKILWVKNHEPEIFAKTRKFLLIEDYFIYRLTGRFATEGSLVCSSTYWDIINKRYWPEMLDFLQIREEQLPVVYESARIVGTICPEAAAELGLGANVTVCTGALDQAAGAIGAGNIKEGMFSENIGAALAICVPVSKPVFDPAGRMPLHYFPLPDTYMIHTFTNGGMTLRWFRDKFCQIEKMAQELGAGDAYDLISKEVSEVPAGSDGLMMLPHLAGSLAPDVNAKAKGVWFGFTLQHGRAHFMRAIMESLGYILKRNIEALGNMGIEVKAIRSLGGGAKSRVWNQIKADINQITLETVNTKEAGTLGAAILAGTAVGFFKDVDSAVSSMVSVKERTTPDKEKQEIYKNGYRMYKKLTADLKDCFDETK
ncbi:FGGY-family carbohydrate kinase [Enterocloster citroniae]|uniref:xylulokinase n=1 Tax=Enterocloster citroniae TaxID=358743 RepID=UPI001D078C6E|nr:FGGY-family carbohydrate kinase [Enterocloster citroniae]MCB7065805.1 FGGY-family carbohydrate kinase [Enterocloster citroniae]